MITIPIRKIKDFSLTGVLTDGTLASTKDTVYRTLLTSMRDSGYVRLLDLDPTWIVEYNSFADKWVFTMVIHGVHVGGDTWQYEGITQSKLIPRSTRQDISSQS
jgi:hypothetical protein